jgi:hypothetical protein
MLRLYLKIFLSSKIFRECRTYGARILSDPFPARALRRALRALGHAGLTCGRASGAWIAGVILTPNAQNRRAWPRISLINADEKNWPRKNAKIRESSIRFRWSSRKIDSRENSLRRHGTLCIVGIPRSSLGFARDFACGLRRPQCGSTSTLPRSFVARCRSG